MFKPLLAARTDVTKLTFPLLASPKLDGVRAIVIDGVVTSRSLKPIPNLATQCYFAPYEHYDGELIVGEPNHPLCYTRTMSGVMTILGGPDVRLYVFDHIQHPTNPYSTRLAVLKHRPQFRVHLLEQKHIHSLDDLLSYEQLCLAQGYEGVIVRDPRGYYKYGRSTANDGIMMKIKRFEDAEATIVGFEELMHNHNPQQLSELGNQKRSSHQANKVPGNKLGAVIARTADNTTFNIGTGFTDLQRTKMWENRAYYLGRICKFKYLTIGVKDAPRHPVWLGLRDQIDIA